MLDVLPSRPHGQEIPRYALGRAAPCCRAAEDGHGEELSVSSDEWAWTTSAVCLVCHVALCMRTLSTTAFCSCRLAPFGSCRVTFPLRLDSEPDHLHVHRPPLISEPT